MSTSVTIHAPIVADDAAQALLDVAVEQVRQGPWPDALVHLRRGDEVLLEATVGAPADTRVVIYSATKGVTNAAIARLVDDGTLDIEARVADVLPWFVGDGKQEVTVEHLLLHTAGLQTAPMRPVEGMDPERRRARMARWRTSHPSGTRSAYHPTAAHWALAAVVQERTGRSMGEVVQEQVLGPLGLRATLGGAVRDTDRLPVAVGEETPREVVEALRDQGIDLAIMLGEAATRYLLRLSEPEVLAAAIPAAGLLSDARDVAVVLAALACGQTSLWSSEVRAAFTHEVRSTLHEPMLGAPANRSLGFYVSGDDGGAAMRGLPIDLGPRVFGQYGSGGNVAWADPDSGLAFTAFTSGLHRDPIQWMTRLGSLNAAAAACA